MYSIDFTAKAEKYLEKIPLKDAQAIVKKVYALKENPFPLLKKLKGQKFWRLRIMKYRVIVDVVVSGKKIYVLQIGQRKNIYD